MMMTTLLTLLLVCPLIVNCRDRRDEYMKIKENFNSILSAKLFHSLRQRPALLNDLSDLDVKSGELDTQKFKALDLNEPFPINMRSPIYYRYFIVSQDGEKGIKKNKEYKYIPSELLTNDAQDYNDFNEIKSHSPYASHPDYFKSTKRRAALSRKRRQLDTLGGSLIAGASFFDDNKVVKPIRQGKENSTRESTDLVIPSTTTIMPPLSTKNETREEIKLAITNRITNGDPSLPTRLKNDTKIADILTESFYKNNH